MSRILTTLLSLGAAAMLSFQPLAAAAAAAATVPAANDLGVYQTTDRKMDYQLTLCGTDNKHLCVMLTAARGSANTPKVKPYLGKMIISQAKPTGKNKWAGQVTMQGYTGDGTLTLNPGKNFIMHGCLYIVVCQDFTLIPAKK